MPARLPRGGDPYCGGRMTNPARAASMSPETHQHHRRSIRLPKFDYSQPGAYFVTICTHQHMCFFGEIVNGNVYLNAKGEIARTQLIGLEARFPQIEIVSQIVMPNHVHAIIIIHENINNGNHVGAGFTPAQNESNISGVGASPTPTTKTTLGNIIGVYKSLVSRDCLQLFQKNNQNMGKLWQRNYYEHIIRDESDLQIISDYIETNPERWEEDEYHP